MNFDIRPYHISDLTAIYKICLLTGNSGKDASGLFKDPDLLGHFYAAPYAFLNPEVCFVITNENRPCGYIIGTNNSEMFYKQCELVWFPILRSKYPAPNEDDTSIDARIIRRIHEGHKTKPELAAYPAHLHIDLLPETQGQGMGRKAMEVFMDKLKQQNVPALHLEVGKSNKGAMKFYEKMGFHVVKEYEHSVAYGMNLF
jgi:ribosomal protein S18 acetylase RimI-like enzyme